ncbi:MAG: hypothetical protein HWD84_09110 [Flavobacteriaceae bacterium]|nr:hypothetical protein [Flavobacteriaceae bacterium]
MRDQEWMKRPELIEHLSRLFGVVPPKCEELLFDGLDWKNTEIWARDRSGQEGPVHELLDKAPAPNQLKIECSEPNEPIVLLGIGRLSDRLNELDAFGLEVSVPQAETFFEQKGFIRKMRPNTEMIASSNGASGKASGNTKKKLNVKAEDALFDQMYVHGRFGCLADAERWVADLFQLHWGIEPPSERTVRNIAHRAIARLDALDDQQEAEGQI